MHNADGEWCKRQTSLMLAAEAAAVTGAGAVAVAGRWQGQET